MRAGPGEEAFSIVELAYFLNLLVSKVDHQFWKSLVNTELL